MPARRKQEEHRLIKHAREELRKINESTEVINQYLNIIKEFVKLEPTEVTRQISVPVLNSLLLMKNLSPLTNDPDEWTSVNTDSFGCRIELWQSIRNPNAFSSDCGETYYLLSEGAHYYNQRPIHQTERVV